jgi:hypothetical protein
MKKLIAMILVSLLFLSCANMNNLTEEEKEAYRKAKQRYDWGQRSGP